MPNTFLQEHPDVQSALLPHDRTLVTKSAKVFLDESLDGNGVSIDFNRKREEESAQSFLEGCSGSEYSDHEVTGKKLAFGIYGPAAMDLKPDYFHGRVRSMLMPESSFNQNLTNGHAYLINVVTDEITVVDRQVAARTYQRDKLGVTGDQLDKAAVLAQKRSVLATKRAVKLGGEGMRPELVEALKEADTDMLGRVSERLQLPSGSV